MNKSLLIFNLLFIFIGVSAFAEDTPEIDTALNKSIYYYNNQQYQRSIELLNSVQDKKAENEKWYYYYALNLVRLKQYDKALVNFDEYIKKSDVRDTARANYYIGLIQFYNGEYEKSLNSLDLALDVSSDAKLDDKIDVLIDKNIRYQSFFEQSKKTNFGFLLGYNADTNVVNLSADSFSQNLSGNVFNYGASASYKLVNNIDFIFEPTLVVLDSYTFDSSFQADSTLQSIDGLQVLVSAPIRFYSGSGNKTYRYNISLNAYSLYLPQESTTRELSLTSAFIKTQVDIPIFKDSVMQINALVAADQSYGYTSDDDDATGYRYEVLSTFVYPVGGDRVNNLFYDLGFNHTSTAGINTRYNKFILAFGYVFPSFVNTKSTIRLGYENLNYPEKEISRTDNQVNFSYKLAREISDNSSLTFILTGVNNSSDNEYNKYSDATLGIQYALSLGY